MRELKPLRIGANHFQVDMRGWMCPYPKYAVGSLIEKLPLSGLLDLLVDCPAAIGDVPDLVKAKGHAVEEVKAISNGEWVIRIKKAGANAVS